MELHELPDLVQRELWVLCQKLDSADYPLLVLPWNVDVSVRSNSWRIFIPLSNDVTILLAYYHSAPKGQRIRGIQIQD